MKKIAVCTGPHCAAAGGGCAIIELLRRYHPDHQITETECTWNCSGAPVVFVDGCPKTEIDPTEDGVAELVGAVVLTSS